jgi:catechol 2,3-dioxygenase-like lactoylglutathione lyase family enzyme
LLIKKFLKMKKGFPRMHVSLYVSVLEKSLDFYKAFFGVAPNKVKSGYAKFILEEPALVISFIENAERVQSNFGHLGFQVETKEIMTERLEAARLLGIVSKEEIGTACCYSVQDKFWAEDPDGVQWEVYYFHEDVEFNDPHYTGEESNACCMPEEKPILKLKEFKLDVVSGETCTPGSGCC